jgi:hypothetical protein
MLEHYKIFIASLRQIYGAKSFVFALLLLFLIATQKAESVEIINHSNIYTGITGVFSSTDYGIVFSNSLGVFSIDKETGAVKNIEFQSEYYYGFDNFFEVDGVLYFYRTEANMYEMYEGKAVYLASNVVAHYVKDNKIYIIRGKEPRIEVISSTKRDSYNTGDEGGTHFAADFIEINGDLIGFMHLNWTGTTLIFKMTDKGPEYIIAPGLPGYAAVDSAILISIREVNGEIWANSFYGNHRLVGNELLPLDEEFSFADTYLRDFYYDNGILFVLTRDSFIKTDLSTKQETILHTIPEDFKGKVSLFKGGKGIYFVINNSIYTYEPEKETLEEHQTLKNEDITIVKESKESELLVVKVDRIEWYNKPVPTVYKGNGPKTNIFLAIDYDPKNKKIVAVGQIGINLIIQEFDGENWNSFNIPYSLRYESQLPSAGLKVDLNGHYLLSIDEFFGIWDGNKWEKISFLEDIPDVKQSEKYQIFCRDSSGGLWLGASIDKFSQEENKNIVSREFWRYYNGEFQVMAKYIPDPTTGYFKKGICMRDGTVRIDLEGKNIYNMNGDKMSKILVSDGKDIPFTNENRNLSLNKDNDLILNFKAIKGWSQKHGSYVFDAGISVYSNAKWDHKKYDPFAMC